MNDVVAGLIASAIAVLFFGSNFLPVKKYRTGDGLFFQFMLCIGIFIVGLFVNLIQGQPEFQPIAMCGGVIWATGNLLTVPVISRIGLALGLLIWGSTALVMGWLSGVVGFMDIKKQTDAITSWGLNIGGMIVALVAMGIAVLVKPEIQNLDAPSAKETGESLPQLPRSSSNIQNSESGETPLLDKQDEDPAEIFRRRVVGCVLAMLAGCFFGINFDPPQYVIDRVDGASQTSLDYAFAHFCGILLTSTFWYCSYCGYKKYQGLEPEVYPDVIVPAIISGMMWGVAQSAFFVANEKLAFVVSFPIVNLGPGFIGFLWGVFVFGEIRGRRNYLVILAMFIATAICVVMVVLSHN